MVVRYVELGVESVGKQEFVHAAVFEHVKNLQIGKRLRRLPAGSHLVMHRIDALAGMTSSRDRSASVLMKGAMMVAWDAWRNSVRIRSPCVLSGPVISKA